MRSGKSPARSGSATQTSETHIRILRFLERLWLFAAALGVICTVYFLVTHDNDSALFFLLFFVLSGLLYVLRKRQRVKY